MNSLQPEVEQAVDAICALGCTVVSDYIRALQQAQSRPLARLALPCTGRFRQRRHAQIGP
jgi:hypothetical protein